MTPYEILGVPPDASQSQITAAYRSLARQFHPDQHPEASAAERDAWTAAMARINQAYAAIGGKEQAAATAEDLSASRRPGSASTSASRTPRPGECDLCSSAPAARFKFQHQHAWLFGASVYTTNLELCQSCALAMGRSKQNRTLMAGWWGVFSFFRNLGIVWSNSTELRRAAALQAPRRAPDVMSLIPKPLDPGSPVAARLGLWVTVVAVGAVVALFASGSTQTNPGSPGGAPWRVGSCVAGSTYVRPVPCTEPHVGRIVATASSPAGCPMYAESYVEDGGLTWCIDE
jgi:hypothetical protein